MASSTDFDFQTLFKDFLPVYERVNIDQKFQIFISCLLCSFRLWIICYLFVNLANNGLLIFWNSIEFCFNKIPEKYSGTESNMYDRDFLQKYLAALTVNHFHKVLHHRHWTGSLRHWLGTHLICGSTI